MEEHFWTVVDVHLILCAWAVVLLASPWFSHSFSLAFYSHHVTISSCSYAQPFAYYCLTILSVLLWVEKCFVLGTLRVEVRVSLVNVKARQMYSLKCSVLILKSNLDNVQK